MVKLSFAVTHYFFVSTCTRFGKCVVLVSVSTRTCFCKYT